MLDLDCEEIETDWTSRGFSCDLWVDTPVRSWEDFTHESDEIVTALKGNMEFEVEGKVYHPKVGEELIIPARAVHSARNIGKTTAHWLFMVIRKT